MVLPKLSLKAVLNETEIKNHDTPTNIIKNQLMYVEYVKLCQALKLAQFYPETIYILIFRSRFFLLFPLLLAVELVSDNDDCQNDNLCDNAKEWPQRRQTI